ncbi:MAG TPA: cytochrome c [Rhizomicrobium sp.]|nr:cytochrome c [Rhizomicrobium sp.]
MMKGLHPAWICLGVAAVAAMGIARADTASAPTPVQIVQARQAALDMSAATFVEMKHAAEAGEDVTKQATMANALAKWAKALPTMFPAGTGAGQVSVPTRARPEIWSDRATFEARAADYQAAAAKLAQLAQAGDAAGFGAQLDTVKNACGACHKDFQAR